MLKTIRFMLYETFTISVLLLFFFVPLLMITLNLLFPNDFFQNDPYFVYGMLQLISYLLAKIFIRSDTQIALTMGARRRDIFLGIQVQVLVYVAECWLSLFVLDKFALAMGLEAEYGWGAGYLIEPPLYILSLVLLMLIGFVSDLLMKKSFWMGIAPIILVLFIYEFLPLILAIAAVEGGLWLLLRRETV